MEAGNTVAERPYLVIAAFAKASYFVCIQCSVACGTAGSTAPAFCRTGVKRMPQGGATVGREHAYRSRRATARQGEGD